jgi:hypothetical protein
MLRNGLTWLKADLRVRGGLLAAGLGLVLTLGVLGFAAGRADVAVTEVRRLMRRMTPLAAALGDALTAAESEPAPDAPRGDEPTAVAAAAGSPEAGQATAPAVWASPREPGAPWIRCRPRNGCRSRRPSGGSMSGRGARGAPRGWRP